MPNWLATRARSVFRGTGVPADLVLIALLFFCFQFLFRWRLYGSIATGLFILVFLWGWLGRKGKTATIESEQLRNVRWTRDFVLAFILGGAVVLLIYALQFLLPEKSPYKEIFALLGAGGLLAMASMMSGALLGFIFGIPRFLRERQANATQAKQPVANDQLAEGTAESSSGSSGSMTYLHGGASQFQSNTNLEEISDWLTKIIVGLGLTKLTNVPDYVKRLTWFVSHSVGEGHHEFNDSIAFSLMTAFSICGFFMGYLMTRLFLQLAFTRTLQEESPSAKHINAEVHSAGEDEPSVNAVPDSAALGGVIQRALSVQRASESVSPDVIRAQISKLAKDYEALRLSMSSSEERTKAMEQVAAQMKSLGFAVETFLSELKGSESAGERLAAITSLEVSPKENSLDWLVERIDSERPFVGYHAALALLSAIRAFTPPEGAAPDSAAQKATSMSQAAYKHICGAVNEAMRILDGKGLRETDRYEVLAAAKKEGMCT